MKINIKNVPVSMTIPIRHKVLWPDKSLDECRVENDENGEHFGAFINGELVCVASIFIDGKNVRLRKFATLLEFQGKGVGSFLLKHIMMFLSERFAQHSYVFWCDARESAISLYERFGMKVDGERFYKGDIPYRKMTVPFNKKLTN